MPANAPEQGMPGKDLPPSPAQGAERITEGPNGGDPKTVIMGSPDGCKVLKKQFGIQKIKPHAGEKIIVAIYC
jgi:hypothetical protein